MQQQKPSAEELKPCPFCGSKVIVSDRDTTVYCGNCWASAPHRYIEIDWNTRPASGADTLVVGYTREQMEKCWDAALYYWEEPIPGVFLNKNKYINSISVHAVLPSVENVIEYATTRFESAIREGHVFSNGELIELLKFAQTPISK